MCQCVDGCSLQLWLPSWDRVLRNTFLALHQAQFKGALRWQKTLMGCLGSAPGVQESPSSTGKGFSEFLILGNTLRTCEYRGGGAITVRRRKPLCSKEVAVCSAASLVANGCAVPFQLYAEKVATRGLCAIAQAESLRYKLLGGLAVRR